MEFFVFQFRVIVSCSDTKHHWEEPGSISSVLCSRYWYTCIRSLDWSFRSPSRLNGPNSLNLCVQGMHLSFNDFSGPFPDAFHGFMSALCWGGWSRTQNPQRSTVGEITNLWLAGIDITFRCNNLCAAPWSNLGLREIYQQTASSQNTVSCKKKKKKAGWQLK